MFLVFNYLNNLQALQATIVKLSRWFAVQSQMGGQSPIRFLQGWSILHANRSVWQFAWAKAITHQSSLNCTNMQAPHALWHLMSHLQFWRRFKPYMYWTICYILYLLQAHFTLDLYSKAHNIFCGACRLHKTKRSADISQQ